MPLLRPCLAALLLGLLAACAAPPPASPPEPAPPRAAPDSLPMPATVPARAREKNPAVAALLAQADVRRDQGDFATAGAQLERALRIDPADPAVYQALAQLRLQQGRAREAEQLALRAANLPGLSAAEQARLWQLVAVCRDRLGDVEGAHAARQRAQES